MNILGKSKKQLFFITIEDVCILTWHGLAVPRRVILTVNSNRVTVYN